MVPQPGLDICQYNILLLGAVGAGKSSFINTLSTVFTGKVEPIAQVRQSASSVTNKLKKYDLRSANDVTLKLRIFDIRGFESERENDKELELLIDGRLPDNYQFPDTFNPDDIIEERLNPTFNDKIHLICFVEGNSDFAKYSDAYKERISRLNRVICNTGLPILVVATKFDKLCPKISKNVDHLFKSPKAEKAVNAIAEFHGVNKNQVLPVVNYVNEDTCVDTKDQLALKALYRMYQSIEGHLKHHTDMNVVLEGWKSRQDVLPDWRDDVEKRNLLNEKLLPFEGSNLKILLVGPVESGKSSFIDSVQSTLRSKIVFNANTGSAGAMLDNPVSTTERFKLYNIEYVDKDTGATRRSGIYLGDTPGFQEQDGIKEDHVKFIISGNVPDGFKIINGIQDTQDDFQRDPQPGDKIHCVCFVFDCEKILKGLSEAIRTSMRKLRRDLIDKGCPYIVILTKCEKVSNSLKTGRQRIFLDSKINECKDKLKNEFGFRQQQVYPIVNYDEQNVVDKQTDRLILAAFFEILEFGKSHMERDEQQE